MTRGVILLSAACLFSGCYLDHTEEQQQPPQPQPPPEKITIDEDVLHIGHETHDGWPAPLGDCVTRTFDVAQLPKNGGYLAFYHAGGSSKGSITINGTEVFSKMTLADQLIDELTDVIACAVAEAIVVELGGSPGSCGGGSVVSITRSLDEGVIVAGSNTAEICRTSGDFVVARLSIGE